MVNEHQPHDKAFVKQLKLVLSSVVALLLNMCIIVTYLLYILLFWELLVVGNKVYENQKKTLDYSKKAIDKAADSIRHGVKGQERKDAIKVIQNFREVHLYPLMLMKNHLVRTANKVSKTKNIIVARRLKRLPTIINKLERPTLDGGKTDNRIKFTRMQDIGGCRAIVKNIKQLNELRTKLENSRSVHKIIRVNEYLIPKESGYGGIHLIYSCFEDSKTDNPWKKLKIEVQLRTELQHHWATSLEIIDIVESLNLKTSSGNHYQWRKFFSCAGTLVAHKEGANVLDPDEYFQTVCGMLSAEMAISAITTLARSALSIESATSEISLGRFPKSTTGMFLLDFFIEDKKLNTRIRHYNSRNIDNALTDYAESESNEKVNLSVLLSAEDAMNLKKAYPNYFGSSSQFIKFIKDEAESLYNLLKFEDDAVIYNDDLVLKMPKEESSALKGHLEMLINLYKNRK